MPTTLGNVTNPTLLSSFSESQITDLANAETKSLISIYLEPTGGDDSAIWQAALDAVAGSYNATYDRYEKSIFCKPGAAFTCATGLDATGIGRSYASWYVYGNGASILFTEADKAGVDLLYSRRSNWYDLSFIGDGTNVPRFGVQIGRKNTGEASDFHTFTNCDWRGQFTDACLYNIASENSVFNECKFYNTINSSSAYTVILDGSNIWGATSDYVTAPSGAKTYSFNENRFNGCHFLKPNAGSAIWVSRAKDLKLDGYAYSFTDTVLVLDNAGEGTFDGGIADIEIHLHGETAQSPGLLNTIKLVRESGASQNFTIRGITLKEHMTHASDYVFAIDSSFNNVTLLDADIEVSRVYTGLTPAMFQTASAGVTVQGSVEIPPELEIGSIVLSHGPLRVEDWTNHTLPDGQYMVADSDQSFDYGDSYIVEDSSHRANVKRLDSSGVEKSTDSYNFTAKQFTRTIDGVEELLQQSNGRLSLYRDSAYRYVQTAYADTAANLAVDIGMQTGETRFATDMKVELVWDGTDWRSQGFVATGPTSNRPAVDSLPNGFKYYDLTLAKIIRLKNGTWIDDATGTTTSPSTPSTSLTIVDNPDFTGTIVTQTVSGNQPNHPSSGQFTKDYLVQWGGATYRLTGGSAGSRPQGPQLPDTGSGGLWHKAPSFESNEVYYGYRSGDYRVVRVDLDVGNDEQFLFDLSTVNQFFGESYTRLYCSAGEGRFLAGNEGLVVVGVKEGIGDFIFYNFATGFKSTKWRFSNSLWEVADPTNTNVDYYHTSSIKDTDGEYKVWVKPVKQGAANNVPFKVLTVDPDEGISYVGEAATNLSPHSGACIYKSGSDYRPGVVYSGIGDGPGNSAIGDADLTNPIVYVLPDMSLSGHISGGPNYPRVIGDDGSEGRVHYAVEGSGANSTGQIATSGGGDTMYLGGSVAVSGRNMFFVYRNSGGSTILGEVT